MQAPSLPPTAKGKETERKSTTTTTSTSPCRLYVLPPSVRSSLLAAAHRAILSSHSMMMMMPASFFFLAAWTIPPFLHRRTNKPHFGRKHVFPTPPKSRIVQKVLPCAYKVESLVVSHTLFDLTRSGMLGLLPLVPTSPPRYLLGSSEGLMLNNEISSLPTLPPMPILDSRFQPFPIPICYS